MVSELKQKRADKLRREAENDLKTNRLAIVFVMVLFGAVAMLAAGKSIDSEVFFITRLLTPLLVISAAALVAAIVLYSKRKGIDDSMRVFTKKNVLGAAIVFFAAMVGYRLTFDAELIAVWLVAAGVLYLVYSFMEKDFFIFSILSAAGVLLFKMCGSEYYSFVGGALPICCRILCLVLAVCGAIFALMHISGKGKIALGKKKLEIGGNAYPMLIASLILAIGGVLGFIAASLLSYVMAALIAAYIIIAIIYAIKMM